MRLQELTTSLTRSQLGVWAGDTMVRFRGSSRSCFTAWGQVSAQWVSRLTLAGSGARAGPPHRPTCKSAQSSLMSHSGLSAPASAVGLAKVGNGLANWACCFSRMFFFCSFPSRRIFNMPGVARSNRERGGTTASP